MNEPTKPTPDELVKVYIKIREAIREKEAAHKEEIASLKEQFKMMSDLLLDHCKEHNATSVVTEFGTFYRTVRTKYWTSDWAAMYDFIVDKGAAHVLEKRINSKAMQEFLEENPESLPAGLNSDKAYTIQVRKPNAK
tara:strand:+ start:929 stop:1339 length:411 start_codon:yes stop_codon:yes gene_type:complete